MKDVYAALDIGASSGRLMIGWLESDALNIEELYRFTLEPIKDEAGVFTDFNKLMTEILNALTVLAKREDLNINGLGVDTWGVDYGWLNASGELFQNPYHYRDNRTEEVIDDVHKRIPMDTLYGETGIQSCSFNTIYQLYYDIKVLRVLEKGAKEFLMLPDLISYFLTGQKRWERTITSTGALLSAKHREWSPLVFAHLEFPSSICGILNSPGEISSLLSKEIQQNTGLGAIPVNSVSGHDSASALLGSSIRKNGLFLISGTWSLLGIETPEVYVDEHSNRLKFSNEAGWESNRYLRLINGLYIIQELKKLWNKSNPKLTFTEMSIYAQKSSYSGRINPLDEEFMISENMELTIRKHLLINNQPEPNGMGDILTAVYAGLVSIYKSAIDSLESLVGRKFDSIQILGGGSRDYYLNTLIERELGIEVVVGPTEASVAGNIMGQMISHGVVYGREEAATVIEKSLERGYL